MQNYDLTDMKVIVVDDNEPMRKILKTILRALGIRDIIEADDGLVAFDFIKENNVDLVIADNLMSPMNGVELVGLIRGGAEGADPFTPFIMISGFTDLGRIVEARDVGINEYLAKPVSATNIYQRISSIIENPRDFVRTASFFGPDRRRRHQPISGPDRRKNEYSYR